MTGLRRHAVVAAGLVLSAAALWFVASSVDLEEAARALGRADLAPAALILAVVAVQVAIRAWRWSILLPPGPAGSGVAASRLVGPMLVGYLGNAVLPARLGEAMRAVIVGRRERVGTTEAFGSVVVERVIDVATLAPVAFAGAVLVAAPLWATQALAVGAFGGVIGIAFLGTIGLMPFVGLADRLGLRRRPAARSVVVRFAATLGGPARRRALLAAAVISTLAWLLDATSFWLAARALGADVSYAGAVLVAGVAVLGTAIPSAPGYVGTFELAAAGTAQALGVPGPQALALAVVVHVMTLVPVALAGAVAVGAMGVRLGEVADAAEAHRHA